MEDRPFCPRPSKENDVAAMIHRSCNKNVVMQCYISITFDTSTTLHTLQKCCLIDYPQHRCSVVITFEIPQSTILQNRI